LDEKHALSPEQIQSKLKNLQRAAGHSTTEGGPAGDVEITVAAQRDAFDLPACRALLAQHAIPSRFVGRGFNQVLVVSRKDSSSAISLITANRQSLLRASPLNAGDYVVGIVAWSLGWGLALPGLGFWFMFKYEASTDFKMVAIPVMFVCSFLLGGLLGYLRCYVVASRR